MQLDEPFREELNNPRRTTKIEVLLLPFQFLHFFQNFCTLRVTADKVRFQHANALRFIYISNYYEVEGIGKRKTAEEIKSDKERHLQKLCGLRARGTEKLKDDRSEGIDVNLMHSDTPLFTFFLRNFYE